MIERVKSAMVGLGAGWVLVLMLFLSVAAFGFSLFLSFELSGLQIATLVVGLAVAFLLNTYHFTIPKTQSLISAKEVVAFRRKLAPYLFVNGVIVIASLIGQSDFFGITVLWSIYLAFKYAKLWVATHP